MQVRNQSYLRKTNKESIIKLLYKKEQSYSELARTLKLSNTAISKIVDDLIQDNIVLRIDETKGRNGIKLKLNPDFGYIIIIDFSKDLIKFVAFDFSGEKLKEHLFGAVTTFSLEIMEKIINECVLFSKSNEFSNKQLQCIVLACPGKIDNETKKFIFNPRFINFKDISLPDMFKEYFSCKILIKNDVKLALIGEKLYGELLSDNSNALMLHIDVGIGAALMTNGKVFEGSHGYSGEIGLFKLNMFYANDNDYINLTYSNYFDYVSLFTVLTLVRNEILKGAQIKLSDNEFHTYKSAEQFTMDSLIEAYLVEDPTVTRIVNSSAKIVGSLARNLVDFLDVDTLILNGAVKELGNTYLDIIKSYFDPSVNVAYTSVQDNATIYGAFYKGFEYTFKNLLYEL